MKVPLVGLKTSSSWIIVSIVWNYYDKQTFNLDHFKGAGHGFQLSFFAVFIQDSFSFKLGLPPYFGLIQDYSELVVRM